MPAHLRIIKAIGLAGGLFAAALVVLRALLGLNILDIPIIALLGLLAVVAGVRAASLPWLAVSRGGLALAGQREWYRGYAFVGIGFATILTLPIALVLAAILATLYPILGNEGVVTVAFVILLSAWFFVIGASFIPVWINPQTTGVLFYWGMLRTFSYVPWSRFKLRRVAGALYVVGPVWTLPLTGVVITRHSDFDEQVTKAQDSSDG